MDKHRVRRMYNTVTVLAATGLALVGCAAGVGAKDSAAKDAAAKGEAARFLACLTSHGIDASRLEGPIGHGENDPVDTNDTDAGRARNRRTELQVQQ